MPRLNYNHLYYFWLIAKEGGVTRACRKLKLSQPTLSAQLKSFEDEIGKPLFLRKSRKLVLTDAGRVVFDYANIIFQAGGEMMQAVRSDQSGGVLPLKVGVLATLPKKDVYDFLATPMTRLKLSLIVDLGAEAELLKDLVDGKHDLVITHSPAPSGAEGLISHPLDKAPIVFVAHRDFKTLKRGFPKSLAGKPLFVPSLKSALRSGLEAYFEKHGVKPLIRGEIHDSELLRVIAVSGDGVVTIEKTAVSDLIKSRELVVLGEDLGFWEEYWLIVSERRAQHPAVAEMLKARN